MPKGLKEVAFEVDCEKRIKFHYADEVAKEIKTKDKSYIFLKRSL